VSHEDFWGLTPAEAYLSIKAHKSNQDDHARQVAGWVATLANVAGRGPKRPLKPETLWQPNLVEPKPAPKAPETLEEKAEAAAREAERRRKNRKTAQRLAAGLPPVQPSKKR
jgi:hypothetical protein